DHEPHASAGRPCTSGRVTSSRRPAARAQGGDHFRAEALPNRIMGLLWRAPTASAPQATRHSDDVRPGKHVDHDVEEHPAATMSILAIDPVRDAAFTAEASFKIPTLLVTMSGSADLNMSDPLSRFVDAVHGEAQRLRARDVRLDLRKLEFMNSSCLKCL